MIGSIRHKGLKKFFEGGDARKLPPQHLERIRRILAQLSVAEAIDDMRIASFRLHALKGDMDGYWSVVVSANWRIVFQLANGTAENVDLLDYH